MTSHARPSLLIAALAAATSLLLAAPAFAGHPPPSHEQARALPLSEALLGTDYDQQLPAAGPSLSFKCENGMAGPYPCKNVDLLGSVPLPMLGGASGNDVWGWTDPQTGREYAVMGASHSTAFVDVTDPANPRVAGILPTAGIPDMVLWRSVRVDGNYAYIVSEITDHGMQVFDLTRLRDATGPQPEIFTEDARYDGVSNTHAIWIDEESDYAYLVGTNTCEANGESGGLHIVDISDPLNPTFAGCATNDGMASASEPNNYTHEVWCETYNGPDTEHQGKEICFASNENAVVIYDVTDKANPQVLSETTYPTAAYTHQGPTTADQRYFLFNDELDEQEGTVSNTTTYIMDISDLDAPAQPLTYEHASQTIDHNMFIHGSRLFQSNYSEGLRILEFDDASLAAGQLTEVAYFDVLPGIDVAEFAGTWSNYRFPGSGNVVLSLIEEQQNGLMVLKPTLPPDETDPGGGGGGGGNGPKKCKKDKGKGGGKGQTKKPPCEQQKKAKKKK